MKARIVLSVIISAVLLQVPCVFPQQSTQDSRLAKFKKAIEQDKFVVNSGITDIMDWAQEYCDGKIANAGYVNKAPYLLVKVPKSAEDSSLTETFQLRPDEAIVLIGVTPPPVSYFGYHTLLWTKAYSDGTKEPKPLHATLGDTVNNATIKTIGPTPFNSPVALIFTPDQTTEARVRSALQRAGYPAAIINTLVFPASMLNLGHGDTADELRIGIRIAKWVDPVAGDYYMQHVSETLNVFRVTPTKTAAANPFPVPPLRVRGTGQTEMDLMNELGKLRQGIIDANPGLQATDIPSKTNWYEGYDYIQRGVNPGVDTRDSLFFTAGYLPEYDSFDKITLADNEFLMVYGANHVTTGKATYMSVNVYASEKAKLSIGQVFNDDLTAATASTYLSPADPLAHLMYAYKISRNCGNDSHCLPLSIDFDCPPLTIDGDTVLGLIFRNYMEPATKVGPAMPEILYDRVIKFSPRKSDN
jgi:hypothetical protein